MSVQSSGHRREASRRNAEHAPQLSHCSFDERVVFDADVEQRRGDGRSAKRGHDPLRIEERSDCTIRENEDGDIESRLAEPAPSLPRCELRLADVIGPVPGRHVVQIVEPDRALVGRRIGYGDLHAEDVGLSYAAIVKPFSAR
jgi:hypothetical protein